MLWNYLEGSDPVLKMNYTSERSLITFGLQKKGVNGDFINNANDDASEQLWLLKWQYFSIKKQQA
jgi:hypothetical protein